MFPHARHNFGPMISGSLNAERFSLRHIKGLDVFWDGKGRLLI